MTSEIYRGYDIGDRQPDGYRVIRKDGWLLARSRRSNSPTRSLIARSKSNARRKADNRTPEGLASRRVRPGFFIARKAAPDLAQLSRFGLRLAHATGG